MAPFAHSRTWLAVAAAITLAAAALVLAPAPAQANGCITPAAGTAQDPYIIATQSNLNCLATNANGYWGRGYHFRQTADLDMTNYGPWVNGIGSAALPFNGTYDGNGFTIDNLTITSSGNGVGLFGVTTGATLKDISLSSLQVTGDRQVGGLVGLLDGGAIEDAQVQTTVTGLCTNANFDCSVGGLVGQIDDSVPTAISGAWTSGSVTASQFGRGAGGLVGSTRTSQLTVSDSYSTAEVTGYNYVGGLVGVYVESTYSEVMSISNSYASGRVLAALGSADDGGLVGCFFDNVIISLCDVPYGSVSVMDTFWDTETTGQASTAAGIGGGKTTAQMTNPSTFTNWSIGDTTPDNATWGICSSLNSGYPFLQWVAEQQGWTCSAPVPPNPPAPAPIPATPPTGAAAQAGDAFASVTWSAPASPGSYAVSTYLVRSSPDGRTCLTATLSCTVTGLRNGTPYTFTVQALSGAGWSSPSEPSTPVVPEKARSIVIKGTRSGAAAVLNGTTSGRERKSLTVMVRFRGERSFTERGEVTPDSGGAFTWRIKTGKTLYAYVTGDGLASNRVTISR